MSNVDPMDKFRPVELENSMTDMLQLLFSKDDMETKAIIRSAPSYASLKSFAEEMNDVGLDMPAKTLQNHIKYRLEFSVSEKGISREQFTDAIKPMNQMVSPDLSLSDRLFTDLKKE